MRGEASAAVQAVGVGASPWIRRFARFGYAAKGVVYLLVGGIALQAALARGAVTDSEGALRTLLDAPFGRVLLGVMAFGLLGYALWRLYCAAANPEHDGGLRRVYFGVSGLLYAGLAMEAARLALGNGGGGGDGASHWSAELLSKPFGGWILGAVGAIILGFGIGQLVHAWKAKLDDQLDLSRLEAGTRRAVVFVSRFGLAARGVVFVVIGVFVLRAALEFDPSQARGVGGALATLQRQPYGGLVLGAVALGLLAYGIYELVRARYRRIRTGVAGATSDTQIRLERS